MLQEFLRGSPETFGVKFFITARKFFVFIEEGDDYKRANWGHNYFFLLLQLGRHIK
jgi:hypothetical protein